MPGGLTSADFDIAFLFTRSEIATYRDAAGAMQNAAVDVPRFDHDPTGIALGLKVSLGSEIGGHDRPAIDPLMLPAEMTSGAAEATVFHRFDPGTGEVRRAYYTRSARVTIDRLLAQIGHHREIGVVAGFRPIDNGMIRFGGNAWDPPALIAVGIQLIEDGFDRPLIVSGDGPVNA